jgi:hypothetical protein
VNKVIFVELVIVLALGWVVAIASIASQGIDSSTLWVIGFFVALTLSFVLTRWLWARTPGRGPPTWAVRLAASKPGTVVQVLLALNLIIGMGSVIGVLICVPVQGVAKTIAGLPAILGTAMIGAAMSVVGFALFFLLLSLLGPVLSVAFEGWIGYIAPVVGGVIGAALESGYASGGMLVVGLSALVGAFALAIFTVSTGGKSVRIKDVGDSLTAGLGFGVINGLILAPLFWVLEILR